MSKFLDILKISIRGTRSPKKIKDPMNAVSLKERRRMVKELVLLDENPKPVYDYLVPTCNRFENEYVATPIKEDATFKEL